MLTHHKLKVYEKALALAAGAQESIVLNIAEGARLASGRDKFPTKFPTKEPRTRGAGKCPIPRARRDACPTATGKGILARLKRICNGLGHA